MNIPEIPYGRIARRIAAHCNPDEYNPHQSLLGTSGTGKSYMGRHGILPIFGAGRIVIVDVKPGGSRTWRGYGNPVHKLSPGFGIGPDGTAHYHLMVRTRAEASAFLELISIEGSCVVVFDDSRRITESKPNWGLATHVDNLLTLGREIGISVLICANSTTWAASGLKDQCGINWIGQMANEEQRMKFARMAGLPKETVPILGKMKHHGFMYSDRFDGDLRIAITRFESSETGVN